MHSRVPGAIEQLLADPVWQAAFFTDSNRLAKEVQRATYPGLAFELFDAARQRYLDACVFVGDQQTRLPFPSPASGRTSTTGDETENAVHPPRGTGQLVVHRGFGLGPGGIGPARPT